MFFFFIFISFYTNTSASQCLSLKAPQNNPSFLIPKPAAHSTTPIAHNSIQHHIYSPLTSSRVRTTSHLTARERLFVSAGSRRDKIIPPVAADAD